MRGWAGAGLGLIGLLLLAALAGQPQSRTVTLALLGDVMLGRGVAEAHAGGDWESALQALRPCLAGADLALANLESPLTAAPLLGPGFDLRAPPEAARALSAAGLDVVSVVNNHALDAGVQGVTDTHLALAREGLAPIVPGRAAWRTVNGLPVAFLAFEDVTRPLDVEAAAAAVSNARRAGGVVIVSVHWGGEYRVGPTERQRFVVQRLADAGASVIWGHHPHVLQPLAWEQGAGRSHPALVAYSLGNALFDQVAPPEARRGAMLLVTLNRRGAQAVSVVPFEIDVRRGRLRLAGEAAATAVGARLGVAGDPAACGEEVP
jgi:poly-gamma-glutamate synthesis protein (capsule biosynthesis protein)